MDAELVAPDTIVPDAYVVRHYIRQLVHLLPCTRGRMSEDIISVSHSFSFARVAHCGGARHSRAFSQNTSKGQKPIELIGEIQIRGRQQIPIINKVTMRVRLLRGLCS
jgi:hypothetical protein